MTFIFMQRIKNNIYSITSVLLPIALSKGYDYLVPENFIVKRGDFVRVSFKNREMIAVVWEEPRLWQTKDIALAKIKPLLSHYDIMGLSPHILNFIEWVADYLMCPVGVVLRQVLHVPSVLTPPKVIKKWKKGDKRPVYMTKTRQRVYDVLSDGMAHSIMDIARLANVSPAVIRSLATQGFLDKIETQDEVVYPIPIPDFTKVIFSKEQSIAVQALCKGVTAHEFDVCLLDGVTGSGKTEVYFEAIAQVLLEGRQALILVPEISLTPQFLERFEQRFSCPPAIWHSRLTKKQRRSVWRSMVEGHIRVLVGARSALFLPWCDLGVIIVDEEHEGSYKQETGVMYHARDMAVVMGKLFSALIVLSSATPSLETLTNARKGRYQSLILPKRHGVALLPQMHLIDMRKNAPAKGCWLSPPLIEEVKQTIQRKEQALIFLNRRGYAPLILCRSCGYRYYCDACDGCLTEHRHKHQLICHYCGASRPMPAACHECGQKGSLIGWGAGVERIQEEVIHLFPQARVIILSSDLIPTTAELIDKLHRIEAGDVDIIIGTQIIAKGHHFPYLSFVGVVDADLGFNNGDLRAGERTYQMLCQVSGRAGRESTTSKAILQSYMPEHPTLQALVKGDRNAFIDREIQMRQQAKMPPFGRLVGIILSCSDLKMVRDFASYLERLIPVHQGVRVLGPVSAPIAKLRHMHRIRFLVKSEKNIHIQRFIASWLKNIHKPSAIRLKIDIDPYNFL